MTKNKKNNPDHAAGISYHGLSLYPSSSSTDHSGPSIGMLSKLNDPATMESASLSPPTSSKTKPILHQPTSSQQPLSSRLMQQLCTFCTHGLCGSSLFLSFCLRWFQIKKIKS